MPALLSRENVEGIYIPSGLIVVGCLIVKREWVPYAIILAALLSGYKLLTGRESTHRDLPNCLYSPG